MQSWQAPVKQQTKTTRATPLVVGASHKNSSIDYRERLLALIETGSAPKEFVKEWALLKTCNRVEFVLVSADPKAVVEQLHAWAKSALGEARFDVFEDEEAVNHLFRVAAGLDSMMVNDGQILDQLGSAGKQARKSGTSRAVLSSLFDAAVSAGSRAQLALSRASKSVAEFAVEEALRELGHNPTEVLLIGSGKMSKIVSTILVHSKIHVASHRSELPHVLAGASLVSWAAIPKVLRKSELVITATSHPGFSVKTGDISDRKRRILVDLGFPRNIEPTVRDIDGVRLLDLDDLAELARIRRQPRTASAEKIIQGEASRFVRWLRASRLSPEVPQLFKFAEQVRTDETELVLRSFPALSPRERRIIEAMGRRITGKILARPAAFAKGSSEELPQEERMRILRAVFLEGSI